MDSEIAPIRSQTQIRKVLGSVLFSYPQPKKNRQKHSDRFARVRYVKQGLCQIFVYPTTTITRRCPGDNEKNHQRSPWRTSTPYVPTSTTLPKHRIRQPHCSNSLSNSPSAKWCPQVVIDRGHRYILLHQSRGAGKLRFDIGVMMHFHYCLRMNGWSYSTTELVCRRQLYTIRRRSVLSRVCLVVL